MSEAWEIRGDEWRNSRGHRAIRLKPRKGLQHGHNVEIFIPIEVLRFYAQHIGEGSEGVFTYGILEDADERS